MNNLTKIDQLFNLLPAHYNARVNPNWNALITALGQSDQNIADLIVQIKDQFFIKTASAPYLDSLAANDGVSRPAGVGMTDASFKKYIPILAYTPKQVKFIVDQLLNIFFAKETTTAFVVSGKAQPFVLQNGWTLEYTVDGVFDELIMFSTADFTNISAASALEIADTINRQAQHSSAESYYDNITKGYYVKIFTNTIGSKGSIQLVGGLANIALQFNGFISGAGTGTNTEWIVTKVGAEVTYQWIGGENPNINLLQAGDVIISLLPNNVGYFPISNVDLSNNSFTFTNLLGTPGTYTQTNATETNFFTPIKNVVYTQISRALTWQVSPGEAIVEMPATPPIVKRSLIGSAHINGSESVVTTYNSNSSITVFDASTFPMSGSFWLQEVDEIITRYYTPTQNTLNTQTLNTRLQGAQQKYTYTARLVLATTGNTVAGSNQIVVASTAGLAVNQNVFMTGVPSYALITNIIGNVVYTDWPATATGTNVIVQFAGNVLTGITPPLPALATLNSETLTSLVRSGGNTVTASTSTPHGYQVGDVVAIYGSNGIAVQTSTGTITNGSNLITGVSPIGAIATGLQVSGGDIPAQTYVTGVGASSVTMTQDATGPATESITFSENLNGAFVILTATSNTFTYESLGTNGTASTPGFAEVDSFGLAPSGSLVIITDALPSSFTRITGPYVWSLSAPFVLSDNLATIDTAIEAGQIVPLLNLSTNTIPATAGYVVFDYGLDTQEGPVKYLYAPNDTTLVLDPSYIFQYDHVAGSNVTSIDHLGPHIMSGLGTEYPPYITDPGAVRETLETLIRSVASSGIFIDFLIRYPLQIYNAFPVYTGQSS